jgi:hypothetical protein
MALEIIPGLNLAGESRNLWPINITICLVAFHHDIAIRFQDLSARLFAPSIGLPE